MRLLLTGPIPTPDASLKSIFCEAVPESEVVLDPLSSEILEQLARGIFDGVVCRADGTEAIELVSRIRGRNAEVPIVVLSAKPEAGFETEAISKGASFVIAAEADRAILAENLRRLLALEGAVWDSGKHARANERLRAELRDAVLERRAISQFGSHVSRHHLQRGLMPLLVENDPEEASTMVQAFRKAEVFAPLPIMRSAQEALAYLLGTPPFENRNLHPLPGAILLDLSPHSLGVELLRWIRQKPEFCTIPVIALGRSASSTEVQEAYGSLANSFLIKPGHFEELVSMIRSIDRYWGRMNIGSAF